MNIREVFYFKYITFPQLKRFEPFEEWSTSRTMWVFDSRLFWIESFFIKIQFFSTFLNDLKFSQYTVGNKNGHTSTYDLQQNISVPCNSVAPADPRTALMWEGDSWTVMETKDPVNSDG